MKKFLCSEDGQAISAEYIIVGLLGHSDFEIVRPEETLVSAVICRHHFGHSHLPLDATGKSFYDIRDITEWNKGLVFSVTPGLHQFSDTYSDDEYQQLKRDGDFSRARYLPSFIVEGHIPNTARKMFASLSSSSDERLNMVRIGYEQHKKMGRIHQEHAVHAHEVTKRDLAYRQSLKRAHGGALEAFA